MTEAQAAPVQLGVVASDPLRRIGLEAIFQKISQEEGMDHFRLVSLTGQQSLNPSGLALVVVDAACTPNLFELIHEFQQKEPLLKLIVMGLENAPEYVERVIAAGAKGYLTHEASEQEMRMAVRIVLDGSIWAPRKVLAKLLEQWRQQREKPVAAPSLTPREKDVLRLLATGESNREIGGHLEIDETTVKAHVGRLMRKVGVANRTALTMRAVELALLRTETGGPGPTGPGGQGL